MSGLQPLNIVKRWFKNTNVVEADWDAIVNRLIPWSATVNNNLKQIGLDLNGDSYSFNNVGRATQTSSIVSRLDALDLSKAVPGISNLGLDISSPNIIKIVSADGTNLGSDNAGQAVFNSTSDAGQVLTRNVTSNLQITLTGAHWGLGTKGDFNDVVLWLYLIDDGDEVVFGVTRQGGREIINTSECETVTTSVTTIGKVLVNEAPSANGNIIELGWVKANFDDTGNDGGEDYWSVQSGIGDINIGKSVSYIEGTIIF